MIRSNFMIDKQSLNSFTTEERENYRSTILENVISSFFYFVAHIKERNKKGEELSYRNPNNLKIAEKLCHNDNIFVSVGTYTANWNQKIANELKSLWADETIQELYRSREKLKLRIPEPLLYYMDNIDKITKRDYLPSDQDIIRSKARSTGIVENSLMVGETLFSIFDTGGQRNERKSKFFYKT
jgi:hypothetical protein